MISNLLSHNPYRILGVFSNSPKKDVLSNLNKMKAFLKIGKNVSFPLDLPQFLPSIDRDETIVSSAQAAIELPMDQIKHTLFWFMKATPLDDIALNHLLAGNLIQAKEIWNKKETVSSLLNLIACALIENDSDSLSIKADTLFQNYSGDFCLAVNETIKLTPSQLTELFVELLKEDGTFELARLMQVSGTSVEWRKIIGGGLVKPIIDEISLAISEAKSAKGSSANYSAGEKLMNSTKALLSQLKGLLGVSDMQYQMIADKLATTILQCGINYFNDTEEDYAVDKAMKLQNYALSIAVGQMAKDRCKENVDVLKNIGPEYAIRKEMNSLGNKIKSFNTRRTVYGPDSILARMDTLRDNYNSEKISSASSFVRNCKPDLNSIKQKLGQGNELYVKISSAVASAAINAIVEAVNAEQQKVSIHGPYAGMLISGLISLATSSMSIIGSLDMDAKCRNYYQSNFTTLSNINSQLNPKPKPTTTTSSGGCYIATMAYGDYDHPQVMVLRHFRDSYLSKREWGQKFINFYYANSPRWVETLKGHKHINFLIREILDSFVYIWKKISHYE